MLFVSGLHQHVKHVRVTSGLRAISVEPRLTSLLLDPARGPGLSVLALLVTATPEGTPLLLEEIPLRSCTAEWFLRAAVRARGGSTVTTPRLGTAIPRLTSCVAMR